MSYRRSSSSPRSQRIRQAEQYGLSLGRSRANAGYPRGPSQSRHASLDIQAELVSALANCEAALKQKTAEVSRLSNQLTNLKIEAEMDKKRALQKEVELEDKMEDLRKRSKAALEEAKQTQEAAIQEAERAKTEAIERAQKDTRDAIASITLEKEDAIAAAREEADAAIKDAQDKANSLVESLRTKYQKTLNAIREQSAKDHRSMQDAVASLTRQLNGAEKAKAEAEERSAALASKVEEAERAEEKMRAAQRSVAALESQIQEFQGIVLRQRSVIGDLNREAQIASAAQSLVADTVNAAKSSATGTDSPRASIALPKGQKLTGMDLRLQQELIMKYEELLRCKEVETARKLDDLKAQHEKDIEAIGETHRQQMTRLRDVCQAQILKFSTKQAALEDHMKEASTAKANVFASSVPPSQRGAQYRLLRQQHHQHQQQQRDHAQATGWTGGGQHMSGSISLDTLGAASTRSVRRRPGEVS